MKSNGQFTFTKLLADVIKLPPKNSVLRLSKFIWLIPSRLLIRQFRKSSDSREINETWLRQRIRQKFICSSSNQLNDKSLQFVSSNNYSTSVHYSSRSILHVRLSIIYHFSGLRFGYISSTYFLPNLLLPIPLSYASTIGSFFILQTKIIPTL